MALNRYLYPPDGTNIPGLKQFFSAVSVDATAPTAPVFTTLSGFGITVTRTAVGTYAVTLDNSSTVAQVVDLDVKAITGLTYNAALVVACRVKSIGTTGFVFETYAPSGSTVADMATSCTLLIALTAQVSGVRA